MIHMGTASGRETEADREVSERGTEGHSEKEREKESEGEREKKRKRQERTKAGGEERGGEKEREGEREGNGERRVARPDTDVSQSSALHPCNLRTNLEQPCQRQENHLTKQQQPPYSSIICISSSPNPPRKRTS